LGARDEGNRMTASQSSKRRARPALASSESRGRAPRSERIARASSFI